MLFDELFNDFFNDFNIFAAQPAQYKSEKKCPVCGRTYSDFRRTGKFGCGECYKTFKAPAAEIMRQIHSSSVHKGKIPSRSGESIRKKMKLEQLKSELQQAVKSENYEKAAKLHKQIKETENNLK